MAELGITVLGGAGEEKCRVCGEDRILMVCEGEYEPGDRIVFETDETDTFYVIRVDSSLDEAYVYLKERKVEYVIPFAEKKISYNPACFTATISLCAGRRKRRAEITAIWHIM